MSTHFLQSIEQSVESADKDGLWAAADMLASRISATARRRESLVMATTSWLSMGNEEMATKTFCFLIGDCTPHSISNKYDSDVLDVACTMMGSALMCNRTDVVIHWYRLWEQDALLRQLSDTEWEGVQNDISIAWARNIALDTSTDWSQHMDVIRELSDAVGSVLIERIFTRAVSNANANVLLALSQANLVDQGLGLFLAGRFLSESAKCDIHPSVVRQILDGSGVTLDHVLLRCTMLPQDMPKIWQVSMSGFHGERLLKWASPKTHEYRWDNTLAKDVEKMMSFFADQNYNEMFEEMFNKLLAQSPDHLPHTQAAVDRHQMLKVAQPSSGKDPVSPKM